MVQDLISVDTEEEHLFGNSNPSDPEFLCYPELD